MDKTSDNQSNTDSAVNRRTFFKTAGMGALGTAASLSPATAKPVIEPPSEIHGFMENGVLKRVLGRTELKVSAVGLGTIPIFQASKELAVSVIRESHELGINYIDTARGYLDGHCEECVGAGIQGIRNDMVIVSKSTSGTAEGAAAHIDESLKTLGTDYIDVYCFHAVSQEKKWDQIVGPDGAMEAFQKAKQAGKIRYIGISGHRSDQLTEIVKSGDIDVVIIPYNYVFDDADSDLWPACQELNIGMAAIKPFAGCFLNQHSLSLRWNLQHPPHISVAGMWQVDEVKQNARHLREFLPLNESEQRFVQEDRSLWYYQLCRFCSLCKPCPENIPYRSTVMMPLLLHRQGLELELIKRKRRNSFLSNMDKIEQCTNCGLCVETCKYHLPIPEMLKEIKRKYYNPVKYYRV